MSQMNMYGQTASGVIVPILVGDGGNLIAEPDAHPWSYVAISGGTVDTVDVTLAPAAGIGNCNYLSGLQLLNKHATVATEVVIKDGAANVIWRINAPAAMTVPMAIVFPNPIQVTPNTALKAACVTTGAAVYLNAQGFVDLSPAAFIASAQASILGDIILDDLGAGILDDLNLQIYA